MSESPDTSKPFGDFISSRLRVIKAYFDKWHELAIEKELGADIERVDGLDLWDQVALWARWTKRMQLQRLIHTRMKRFDTPAGEFELVASIFGDQIGLPASKIPVNNADRLEWYKRRIAAEYERKIKRAINRNWITSPIEQIFLMEWHILRIDERYAVRIQPQKKLVTSNGTVHVDFVVTTEKQGELKLAIELDGHDFHERSKEQVAKDKSRERSIVKAGYTIFRFSGSEIFRNVRRCVSEVEDLIKAHQIA